MLVLCSPESVCSVAQFLPLPHPLRRCFSFLSLVLWAPARRSEDKKKGGREKGREGEKEGWRKGRRGEREREGERERRRRRIVLVPGKKVY